MQLSFNLERWQIEQSRKVPVFHAAGLMLHLLPTFIHPFIAFTHRDSAGLYILVEPRIFNISRYWKARSVELLLSGRRTQSFRLTFPVISTEESAALHCFANRSWGWERRLVESLTLLSLEILTIKSLCRNDLISAFRFKKEPGCVPNDCGAEGVTELLIAGTAPRDLMICDILSGALR